MMKRTTATMIGLLALTASTQAFSDTVNSKHPEHPRNKEHVFTRMFGHLPAFAPQTDLYRQGVKAIGAKGGFIDAQDNLTDPIQSIINQPVFSPNNLDNPNMTAGVTFFGQFLDHDITLDKKSELQRNANPRKTINFRTAAFDLDSVYGDGPENSPELYDTSSGFIKFKVEANLGSELVSRNGTQRFDLPRNENDEAIVGDSRNDENIVLSQFHLAMLKFHNAVTDQLITKYKGNPRKSERIFEEAQQTVRWHYQWIILHEFLPQTIGQDRLDHILSKKSRYYDMDNSNHYHQIQRGNKRVKTPRIPIEFSVAAYRFGHSQVRPSYRVNFGPTGGSPFFAFIFDDNIEGNQADPADMRGGSRAPRRFIDWQTFFDFGDGLFRNNKRIDSKLSTPLMLLPGVKAPSPGLPDDGVQSLASRNLMRHVNFGIPSGQAIAVEIGAPTLSEEDLAELVPYGLSRNTPLWYYVLKEAEVMENGLRMGPVGSYIVGTVFVNLLRADDDAYLSKKPKWTPTLPSKVVGEFKMTDLLNFAGVVPAL